MQLDYFYQQVTIFVLQVVVIVLYVPDISSVACLEIVGIVHYTIAKAILDG